MSNPFYTATSTPGTRAPGASAPMRAEFVLIQAAFDKLPGTLTANKAVVVNSGGTGLTVSGGSLALAGDLTTTSGKAVTFGGNFSTVGDVSVTGAAAVVLNVTGGATLQLPGASGTLLSDNNTVAGITNKGFSDATANTQAVGDASTKLANMAALQALLPVGMVLPYAGSSAPSAQWALCAGQAISRSGFAALFAIIGTTYGTGDGSTTFNLPDLRGRVVAGLDNMGGSNANRLSTVMSSSTLGASGGAQTQIFAVSGSVSGNVSVSGNLTTASTAVGGGAGAAAGVGDFLSGTAFTNGLGISGTTDTRSITQPTMVMNHIIKVL